MSRGADFPTSSDPSSSTRTESPLRLSLGPRSDRVLQQAALVPAPALHQAQLEFGAVQLRAGEVSPGLRVITVPVLNFHTALIPGERSSERNDTVNRA